MKVALINPDNGKAIKKENLGLLGIAGIPLRALSLTTSRGCPFHCIFCRNSKRTVPVRTHSLERVMTEIKTLIDSYGVESLAGENRRFCTHAA